MQVKSKDEEKENLKKQKELLKMQKERLKKIEKIKTLETGCFEEKKLWQEVFAMTIEIEKYFVE